MTKTARRVNVCRKRGYEHCGYCQDYPYAIVPAEPGFKEGVRMVDREKR
ncbi:hypothetical protein [Acutalibacter intestini]|nr:hypothetical protein [Acutalibacter sp. M00204]